MGEDMQINQVRDEYLFFMTKPMRVSVYTPALPSVPSRFNLHTAMIPGGAINRRTRSIVCRLTGWQCVDMKYESHNFCAFSSIR
jgi:hypothetical protein